MNELDVFWNPDVLLHDTGAGLFEAPPSELMAEAEPHPENAVRIFNMQSILEHGPLRDSIRWRDGRAATREELELVHDPAYIDTVRDLAETGGGRITATTVVSPDTFRAALAAAGTVLAATEAVLDGDSPRSYALVRPPGHHAQPARADGYCFFNNVAIAAEAALARPAVDRVAIIDWDVHHGNGTQECFYGRDDVLTVSLHMHTGAWGPSHPQTGTVDETGAGQGAGYNLNVDLPLGTGDAGYRRSMTGAVAPLLRYFRPDLLIVAAGQDAAQFDPNGRQNVTMGGFHQLGHIVRDLADELCEGRLVFAQEGGYSRSYAAWCLHSTLEGALRLEPSLEDPLAFIPDEPARADGAIAAALAAMRPRWPGLGERNPT